MVLWCHQSVNSHENFSTKRPDSIFSEHIYSMISCTLSLYLFLLTLYILSVAMTSIYCVPVCYVWGSVVSVVMVYLVMT